MPRSMDGHGFLITRKPPSLGPQGVPSRLTTWGSTPKNGIAQLPGLASVIPGSGVIMMPPASVCHQASTIREPPPRLPTGVDERAGAAADDLVVPHPGLGVDRLPDATEQPQRRQIVLLRQV